MRFAELVEDYEKLDATTKRLELRSILAGLIHRPSATELPIVLYLSQGLLRPEYEGIELGVADSIGRKAVALAADVSESEVERRTRVTGDLGTTAEEIIGSAGSRHRVEPLDVREVYDRLMAIAGSSGVGSQEKKVQLLVDLLRRCSPVEAKYAARVVLGQLRLGVREMTILDALAEVFGQGSKEARAKIEAAFNVSSDLGLVAEQLKKEGLDGLAAIRLTVGRPIRAMLAERAKDLPEVLRRMEGRAAFEYKYDGLRVQAHIGDGTIELFSRRLERISAQFPELVRDLPSAIRSKPAIVEGECVPLDPETDEIRPFQEVSRRRGRKHDLERLTEEVPVCLFLFDVLLKGDREVMREPFPDRRAELESMIRPMERIRLAEQKVVTSLDEAEGFFDGAIAAGCEGIMAKSLAKESAYRAGARGFWWIKYKREYTSSLADSIDGVVVGAFHGRGRRAGTYGALLLAAYNPKEDRFESFCKVGSGFDDAHLRELPARLRPFVVKERPSSVLTELTADVWFRPTLVLEVRGAELSLSPIHRAAVGVLRPNAGLALRFPRFTGRFRDDKDATGATTTNELVELYQSQVRQAPTESSSDESSG